MTPQEEYDYVVELLLDNGYDEADGVVVFDGRRCGYSYYSALVGVSEDGTQAIYDWDKMIEYLVTEQDFDYESAVDYASYNAIGVCGGANAPIIMYPLRLDE